MSIGVWISYRLIRLAVWINPMLLALLLESADKLGVGGRNGRFYKRAKALGEQNA